MTANQKIFDQLYAEVDGYNISALSRINGAPTSKDLTYGEIDFVGFNQILEKLELTVQHKVFCDLGSGTGKAVLASALSQKFTSCFGVELLPDLYKASQRVLRLFNQSENFIKTEIDFFQADFLQYDFSRADVVLVQCTCMNEETMEQLQQKLNKLKPGSLVITVTQNLQPPFVLQHSEKYKMGWGEATVFINQLS